MTNPFQLVTLFAVCSQLPAASPGPGCNHGDRLQPMANARSRASRTLPSCELTLRLDPAGNQFASSRPTGPRKEQHQAANSTPCGGTEDGTETPVSEVKRSLQLEKREGEATPRKKDHKVSVERFSPVTGTQCLSPFTPKDSEFRAKSGVAASNTERTKVPTRGHLHADSKELNVLRSKVEKSVLVIKATREKLSALQALEGSKEFEYFIGAWNKSGDLTAELRRNRELMAQGKRGSNQTAKVQEN
ncbi:centromere protein R [Heterodontus francisci]|uniref:centromere protein R n=1 Tax=Heterodontus francisci TaxID=7792 RepID=UPI00355B409D